MPYAKARVVEPGQPLPYADDTFDLIYQVSVLTHVDEETHKFLLEELSRVAKPGGVLLLTVRGKRVLEQALNLENPGQRVNMKERQLRKAARDFEKGKYVFELKEEHLRTTAEYNYGIAFIPPSYIQRNWSRYFDVVEIREGGLNNHQDIVVLRGKASRQAN